MRRCLGLVLLCLGASSEGQMSLRQQVALPRARPALAPIPLPLPSLRPSHHPPGPGLPCHAPPGSHAKAAQAVKGAFLHAWRGSVAGGIGGDELEPVSGYTVTQGVSCMGYAAAKHMRRTG
jgi:hypothetical protein